MAGDQAPEQRKTVAVFDPEARSRAVILPMLEGLGYRIDEHHSGQKIASRTRGEKRADLIFVHLAVFGDSYAAVTAGLEALALNAVADRPPLLAISVLKLSPEARQRLLALGCDEVLARQAPLMEVVFAVNRLLFPKYRELRRYSRVFGGFPVEFGDDGGWRSGAVYNISREGAFVQCDQPLAEGQRIQLRFALPGMADALQVAALVSWINPPDAERDALAPVGMGISFLALGNQAQTTLGRFIAARENGSDPAV